MERSEKGREKGEDEEKAIPPPSRPSPWRLRENFSHKNERERSGCVLGCG